MVGRLAADPEVRSTMDGLPMAKFKLVVARPDGGNDLIDVVAWRKLAEDCGAHLKKGKLALIEGRIQNRTFEDQTGKRRWVTEIVARSAAPLERPVRAEEALAPAAGAEKVEEFPDEAEFASDLPF